MDYLRLSARNNETIRTKIGLKKDILQEIEVQQLRWYGHIMRMEDCKITRHAAEWNPQEKRGAADQSIHGRMGLGTACKEETSRMKNVSIESSGGKNYAFGLRKTACRQKN
jgi:hypothetical protein